MEESSPKEDLWPELLPQELVSRGKIHQQEYTLFRTIIDLLRKLVQLAQERNTLALASLSELRDIHKLLLMSEKDVDEQTVLLTQIADELKPPPPSPAAELVITLGKAVPQ